MGRLSLVVEILARLAFDPHLTSVGAVGPQVARRTDRFTGA
jgi:hypothetical protein